MYSNTDDAIIAVRFTDYFVGTQFHPWTDPMVSFPLVRCEGKKLKK
jgi:hypothetical protein